MTDEPTHIATAAAEALMRCDVGMAPARWDAPDDDRCPLYVRLRDYRALVAENARLWAERDAAWQAGAKAMRGRAAYEVAEVFEHHCAEQGWKDGEQLAANIAHAIRALPLPDQPKEGAQ